MLDPKPLMSHRKMSHPPKSLRALFVLLSQNSVYVKSYPISILKLPSPGSTPAVSLSEKGLCDVMSGDILELKAMMVSHHLRFETPCFKCSTMYRIGLNIKSTKPNTKY